MPEELSKVYSPKEVEEKWYKFLEENKLFTPEEKSTKKPFTIVIPPPNVTGSLHMGHALNNTIQDILIRYKKMSGFNTLWLPGTDHAGIATQNVVEKELAQEGKKKEDIGREAFLKRTWEWKEKYGGQIIEQLKRLGSACDWTRLCFTLDEKRSKAVRKAFVELFKEGLIYRGKRIINWCPRCQTALSDVETEYHPEKGKLWYIKYPLETRDHIVVATTRPETMLGDTAVAVHPEDERYKNLIGKMAILPLVNRRIPIIKDEFVDPRFGTGAVKVTPAHDPFDFEIGLRHNLPQVNMLYKDGRVNVIDFEEGEKKNILKYEMLDRFAARKELVKDLEAQGFIEKVEDYEVPIAKCYRCKTPIEPYLSDQWFVRVKELVQPAIRAVEAGKIRFSPERWTKVYLDWMENLRDWCISRQIWWGHRIPVYFCAEHNHMIVSEEEPKKCPQCGSENLIQDSDVLDTWFSSALWPFSTLGWPEKTSDLKIFYSTDVLVTGYDIITFWVSRMVMMGLKFMKEIPFHTVYIHGLVRDIYGKKMSKSLGNVIDPLNVIDKAGADALRFSLVSLITGQGQDIKLSEDKIVESRNFANKIWNVSRFVLMNLGTEPETKQLGSFEFCDRWILSRYNQNIKQVTELLEAYDFGEAARVLYEFIWHEFCDWYVEMAKERLYGKDAQAAQIARTILLQVLDGTVRMLHPFMPFITEEIWQKLRSPVSGLPSPVSIMLSQWPKAEEKFIDLKVEEQMNLIMEVIRAIRNLRKEEKIEPKKEIEMLVVAKESEKRESLKLGEDYIKRLAKLSRLELAEGENSLYLQSFTGFRIYL